MVDVRTAESTVARPPLAAWVDAPVNYLADLSIKPVTYNPPHGTGVPRRETRASLGGRRPSLATVKKMRLWP